MSWLTHKDDIHANANDLFILMLPFNMGDPFVSSQRSAPGISGQILMTCKQTDGLFKMSASPLTSKMFGVVRTSGQSL